MHLLQNCNIIYSNFTGRKLMVLNKNNYKMGEEKNTKTDGFNDQNKKIFIW